MAKIDDLPVSPDAHNSGTLLLETAGGFHEENSQPRNAGELHPRTDMPYLWSWRARLVAFPSGADLRSSFMVHGRGGFFPLCPGQRHNEASRDKLALP